MTINVRRSVSFLGLFALGEASCGLEVLLFLFEFGVGLFLAHVEVFPAGAEGDHDDGDSNKKGHLCELVGWDEP